jgi:hypothetical protein
MYSRYRKKKKIVTKLVSNRTIHTSHEAKADLVAEFYDSLLDIVLKENTLLVHRAWESKLMTCQPWICPSLRRKFGTPSNNFLRTRLQV